MTNHHPLLVVSGIKLSEPTAGFYPLRDKLRDELKSAEMDLMSRISV
jgi:hypothetical protein